MRRLTLAALLLALAIVTTGCCCGEEFSQGFKEGYNEAIADNFNEMSGRLRQVEDSPHKDKVQKILDDGVIAAGQGKYGTINVGIFQAEFDSAVRDGEITKSEAKSLKALYKAHIAEG
jgi:hypothetical protein